MVRLQEAGRPAPGSACFVSGIGTLQFARADVDCLSGARIGTGREGGGGGEARGVGQRAGGEEVEMDVMLQESTVP